MYHLIGLSSSAIKKLRDNSAGAIILLSDIKDEDNYYEPITSILREEVDKAVALIRVHMLDLTQLEVISIQDGWKTVTGRNRHTIAVIDRAVKAAHPLYMFSSIA